MEEIRILTGVFAAACIQKHFLNMEYDEEESCLKSLSLRSRPSVLRWFFVQMRKRRRHRREALSGFAAMVLRYADVQFAEDFRMNRKRFLV
jgi:hypothetical protein